MKVSVLMITYNHEQFIAQALESVLEQQTDFDYEIVIGEDCSTDQTRKIIKDYQKRYPSIIRPLLPEKNLGMHKNFEQTLQSCRGQYIALLEGDDYWTAKDKLKKQVDFLDQHPECCICFHNVQVFHEDGSRSPWNYSPETQKEISDVTDLLRENFMATPSVLFRNSLFAIFPEWFYKLKMADWTLHLLNAQFGKIGYITDVMAAYRIHPDGVWSSTSFVQKLKEPIKLLECINTYFGFGYEKIITDVLARRYKQLMFVCLRNGDLKEASRCLIKLLRYLIKYCFIALKKRLEI